MSLQPFIFVSKLSRDKAGGHFRSLHVAIGHEDEYSFPIDVVTFQGYESRHPSGPKRKLADFSGYVISVSFYEDYIAGLDQSFASQMAGVLNNVHLREAFFSQDLDDLPGTRWSEPYTDLIGAGKLRREGGVCRGCDINEVVL
jgi:hypothetical protein